MVYLKILSKNAQNFFISKILKFSEYFTYTTILFLDSEFDIAPLLFDCPCVVIIKLYFQMLKVPRGNAYRGLCGNNNGIDIGKTKIFIIRKSGTL